MKKMGLGRGLDVLLPDADDAPGNAVIEIAIHEIDPNEDQPRRAFREESLEQLAQSIREVGIIQPILVYEEDGRYRIIAGERRWRAARRAGLHTVPCVVRDVDRVRQMEYALIENLQREDLNPIEEASAIRALMEQCGLTQESVSQRLGKSRPAVANLLRILNLPEDLQALVIDGSLTAGHARVLAGVEDVERKRALSRQCISQGLNVRQLEQLAAKLNAGRAVPLPPKPQLPELTELENTLRETFGVRATLTGNRKKGKILLQYYSAEELDQIYELLQRLR